MIEREPPPDLVAQRAVWNADEHKWEVCPTDENGERDGECLLFREEGQLYSRSHFRAGVREGSFAIYHPNGQLARKGSYVAGEIDGPVFAYASDALTTERLRGCCVPENAWELQATYQTGQLTQENFYDRQGRALLDDGTLQPEKPPSVDDAAGFDQSLRRWRLDKPGEVPESRWARFWSSDGALLEDVEYRTGGALFSRLFDADGRVKQECTFVENNRLDGPYLRRFISDEESPYADRRIREERGRFDRGQAVATWTFLDANGEVIRAIDRGTPFSEEQGLTSAVFAEQAMDERSTGRWRSLARDLAREGRLREALCAAARAAACAKSASELTPWLEAQTVALLPEEREQRGQRLILAPDATLAMTLDALIAGADAAAVLRTLAALATGASPAARDFIEASLLLAPDRQMSYLTRALVRIELGDDRGALEDADRVEMESPPAAGFVRDYARILFAPYSFRAREDLALSSLAPQTMPVAIEQPLEAIRRAIQVYATRLAVTRAALAGRIVREPEPSFLPPYLAALLPDGPLSLRAFDAVIHDDTEAGPEETSVRIDEAIETAGRGVPALLCAARYDHCALSWLCWSVGLDRIALPDRVVERPEFAAAASMAVAHFWRAQDRLSTGGLIARSQGIAGFEWEGFDIDAMPQRFAEIAAAEYLELRSLFLWLASADNLSPFQSDLRT